MQFFFLGGGGFNFKIVSCSSCSKLALQVN